MRVLVLKIAFIVFLSFSLVNVNMAFSQNVNKTDLEGKCFYRIIKEDSDDIYGNSLCFEEKLFKYQIIVSNILVDATEVTSCPYSYWHDWSIKDNQLFFRNKNKNDLGFCIITREKEIITFSQCENEWGTLSGRWRQGEFKDICEK